MRCPICSSDAIIWDYYYGQIVCTNCGTVIDIVYTEYQHSITNDYARQGLPTVREGITRKRQKEQGNRLRSQNKEVRLYEIYARRARKDVMVDFEALRKMLHGGSKERIYIHKSEPKLREQINQDKELQQLLTIIDQDPLLASRTLRGKVAIALMLKYVLNNMEPDFDTISKFTSLSRTHVRRLYKQLYSRLHRIAAHIRGLCVRH